MFKIICFVTCCLVFVLYNESTIAKSSFLKNKEPIDIINNDLWHIGLQGLYLKPNNIKKFNNELETHYHWGFSLKGEFQYIPQKRVRIQWLHYKQEKDHLQKHILNYVNEGSTVMQYGYKRNFDILFFELSQALDFEKVNFRLHGGLEYVNVHYGNVDSLTSNVTASFESTRDTATYNAIGPVVGIDFIYLINAKLQLYILDNIGIILHNEDGLTQTIKRDNTTGAVINSNIIDNINNNSSTASVYFESGLDYKSPIKDGYIDYQLGWMAISYNLRDFFWSGAFIGGKLVANV